MGPTEQRRPARSGHRRRAPTEPGLRGGIDGRRSVETSEASRDVLMRSRPAAVAGAQPPGARGVRRSAELRGSATTHRGGRRSGSGAVSGSAAVSTSALGSDTAAMVEVRVTGGPPRRQRGLRNPRASTISGEFPHRRWLDSCNSHCYSYTPRVPMQLMTSASGRSDRPLSSSGVMDCRLLGLPSTA